ncbi:hypothetical protein BDV12DRAFT_175000 [Aspergillus spectabilis]
MWRSLRLDSDLCSAVVFPLLPFLGAFTAPDESFLLSNLPSFFFFVWCISQSISNLRLHSSSSLWTCTSLRPIILNAGLAPRPRLRLNLHNTQTLLPELIQHPREPVAIHHQDNNLLSFPADPPSCHLPSLTTQLHANPRHVCSELSEGHLHRRRSCFRLVAVVAHPITSISAF